MKNKFFRRFLGTSSLLFVGFTNLNAQSDNILASISSDMSHYNDVATKTKQNEHYQPYIISVFQGKEFEKLGMSNLKEALLLVPGIDMSTDNMNVQTPIFRGSNSVAYGQTKLFIDDVLVNNLFFDAYSEYLGMPIEMIKRIEVVRGPGSKTNGVNAYAGSIKVITYAEDFKDFESKDKMVFKYGSDDYKMAGFIKKIKTKNLDGTIDFYYQEDDKKLYAGQDGYSTGSMSISGLYDNTSLSQNGDAPVWAKDYSLGLNFKYKDFYLKGRHLDHSQGSAYGINLSLPRDEDRVKLPSTYLELGYDKQLNDFYVDIKAGIKEDSFDSNAKLAPDGMTFMDVYTYRTEGTINTLTFNDGIYGEHLAKQRTVYQSSYLTYTGIENHIITTGYKVSKEETIDMVSKLSSWSTGVALPVYDYTDTFPFFNKDAKRDVQIFSMQDEFKYDNSISYIYGFNYEQTSYKDAGFEPRISMVYQRNPQDIYKVIYSKAHRNPSWQEMFTANNSARVGNTELEPEKVDAFELVYIKKYSSDSYLQTNLFHLKNKDQIYNSASDPKYRNVLDTDIYGLELEYTGHISSADKLYLNYSYVTGRSTVKDTGITTHLSNVAHHLAKGYYTYELNNALSTSGIAKYVSEKYRAYSDNRAHVPAYATLDLALNYKNHKSNYDVSFSIKNIADKTIKYPAPVNTYTEDYTQEGRSFLVALKKEF